MPSKIKPAPSAHQSILVFLSLTSLTLIFWYLYRFLFNFSVLFDETLGKAVFFGLSVVIYVNVAGGKKISETLSPKFLFRGLLRGVAYAGIFGFVTVTFLTLRNRSAMMVAPLFISNHFWFEFLLATLTAFWESLFFFGFIQTVLTRLLGKESLGRIVLLTSLIFLLFHLPNIVLRFAGLDVSFLIALLYLFGFGQSLLFIKEKNIYPLIVTHAIWGMILLIHY